MQDETISDVRVNMSVPVFLNLDGIRGELSRQLQRLVTQAGGGGEGGGGKGPLLRWWRL